jgi:hypothetical protein
LFQIEALLDEDQLADMKYFQAIAPQDNPVMPGTRTGPRLQGAWKTVSAD